MRILALFAAMLTALPAQAFCFLGCDTEIADPIAATTAFEALLGKPLPPSVTVERILQGGFQDKFVQVLITTDQAGVTALLPLLELPADPTTPVDARRLGPGNADWWNPQQEAVLLGGSGKLDGFADTTVAIAPFPGTYDQTTVYIFAFQT